MDFNFLNNPWFWGAIIALATLGWGIVRSSPLRSLPIVNNKKMLLWIGIFGLMFTIGFFGKLGLGSLGSTSTAVTAMGVSNLQVTTAFQLNGGTANVAENANVDDLLNVRANDTSISTGTASVSAGIITVTRTGDSKATSCTVRCVVPANFQNQTSQIGDSRNILNVNGKGEYGCFLNAGSSGSAATTSSPRMVTSLPFAEGINTAYVGVALDVDLLSLKYLTQYNSKTVTIDVCGKPFNIEIDAMSAH